MITKFGKKIKLEVFDSPSFTSPIFVSGELRVDFHVKLLQGYNRGKFDIYNLSPKVIGQLSKDGNYVRLSTSLHDGGYKEIGEDFFINNAMTVKQVPNSITSLYGVSVAEKDLTPKQLKQRVRSGSLRRQVEVHAHQNGYQVKYDGFPDGMIDYIPLKNEGIQSGSYKSLLQDLGKQYNFTPHFKKKVLTLQFHPNKDNLHLCKWDKRDIVVLKTENLLANVEIGSSAVRVKSVLDADLVPSKIIDTSELITANIDASFDVATVSGGYFKDTITGTTQFAIISTEHKGSNYTKLWESNVYAIRTASGTHVNIYNWFGE